MTKSRSLSCSPPCHQSQREEQQVPLTLFCGCGPPSPLLFFVCVDNKYSLPPNIISAPSLFHSSLEHKQTQVDRLICSYTNVLSFPPHSSVFKWTALLFISDSFDGKGTDYWSHVDNSHAYTKTCTHASLLHIYITTKRWTQMQHAYTQNAVFDKKHTFAF